jgi:multidrug efflux system outer membrane protein
MKRAQRKLTAGWPRWCAFVALTGLFFSCTVGPDYHHPAVNSPDAYRHAASDTNTISTTNSFGDIGWWDVYDDPQLKAYIDEALTNSWDIKIAAARVLEAEASAQIVRSQFFPSISAGGDLLTTRSSQKGPIPIPEGAKPQQAFGEVFLSMSPYELDLWGRIRRANEAARARLFESQDARRLVRQTLVAQVATTYLQLLELDLELQIGRSAYANRTNSLALTQSRQQGGVSSMQDVYSARALVATAQASIVNTSRLIEQTENQMNILLGHNPGGIARGGSLENHPFRANVPPGLPSALMERRPDIRAAEEELVAANANIGQAKAAFYPQVSLTGAYGYQSVGLSDLFTGPARMWQFGPSVSFPLFTGGRLRGNLHLAKATFEETIAHYQQTVQNAFREVSDALISYQRSQEFFERQQELAQAYRDAAQLAGVRYEGGVVSYLEVLYNEQQLFDAELLLAQAHRDELLSVVELYRSLGGGWSMPATNQIVATTKPSE